MAGHGARLARAASGAALRWARRALVTGGTSAAAELKLALVGLAALAITVAVTFVVLVAAGGGAAASGSANGLACGVGITDRRDADWVQEQGLAAIYDAAARRFQLGARGSSVLAAINKVETDFGRNAVRSPAGAVGWMQFLPSTWAKGHSNTVERVVVAPTSSVQAGYATDGSGDGLADTHDKADAIHAAARSLQANGAPGDWYNAVLAYNPADWYVQDVLKLAATYQGGCAVTGGGALGPAARVRGSAPDLVEVPGSPGARCDERIIENVVYLIRRFRLRLGDCYAPTGHSSTGEHPLGLAIDVWPADGNWSNTMAAARFVGWDESCAASGCPNTYARWIGYNGVADHGDPAHCSGSCPPHLHISWNHAESPYNTRAAWVTVWQLPTR